MPKVTFLPDNKTVQVNQGTSILDAALENGIKLMHNCGGVCACTTCHVIVREGDANLSEMELDEDDRLSMADGLTMRSRLGCQAVVERGGIVVEIPQITSRLSHDE